MANAPDTSPKHDDPVPDDAGTDADVDPGLLVPGSDEPSTSDPAQPADMDERSSTNHTGLTPDSIQVD